MEYIFQNTETEVVGERTSPQVKVTKNYLLKGVDLTGQIEQIADEDEQVSLIDDAVDEFKKNITRIAHMTVDTDPEVVGFDAEVSEKSYVDTYEKAKNIEFDVAISVFYDVPVTKLESLIDNLQKEIAKAN